MKDIMNGMKLDKWQCLVAMDDCGTGWIIAKSNYMRDRDVLIECSADDCGFNTGWDNGIGVGVYKCTLKPWSHTSYDGEMDWGLDVVTIEPLWEAA